MRKESELTHLSNESQWFRVWTLVNLKKNLLFPPRSLKVKSIKFVSVRNLKN